jgi:tetratricopeptide (TPR) repeat protein
VTVSIPHRRIACAALAFFTIALPNALAAHTPNTLAALLPSRPTVTLVSASGSYLAARHASALRDSAMAAKYYRAALKADPKNSEILNRAFLSMLAGGDVAEAVRLAERVIQVDRDDRMAHLVLGVRALKHRQYTLARQNLAQSVRGPISDLAATLAAAWAQAGQGHTRAAIQTIDKLSGPDWYAIFKNLHAGLIYDFAGRQQEAGKRLESAYKLDSTALRVVEAYGRWTSRYGSPADALKIFETFNQALPDHPLITSAVAAIKAGRKLPPLIESAQSGAAEVFYGLGASIGRRGGESRGLIYLQLALYLAPSHAMALLSLGDLYEAMKKPDLAIKVYERMPAKSPLRRNAAIQLATDLDALDRTDEARQHLEKLIAADPKDIEAIMALGNILRARKKFADCADVYSKGIAAIEKPTKANWTIFYFRGICYERSKQWPKAEVDLKKALELFPDQPHVLNYLGYSWVDQGIHLEEGMKMIRRAVEQRPDDGYIVDSLGWAYYRIGNYKEAVKNLERAVELKPEDPTINDHLGDAYWRVGRELEARFQWTHARDLKPDPEELPKIVAKLKSGLVDDTPSTTADKGKKPDGG